MTDPNGTRTLAPAGDPTLPPPPDPDTRTGAPDDDPAGTVDHPADTRSGAPTGDPPPPGPAGPPAVAGYEVVRELGRGGMGVVYEARETALNRTVALKMVLAGAHARPDDLVRFLHEAESVARLRHAHVVEVFALGRHDGLPFLAMEYVGGGTLADRVKDGPLPPGDAARLAEQVARGVAACHAAGVLHRDLKPQNVLLAADGAPKITDFGLAKNLAAGDGLTATGAIMGTPSYMAPEQARGDTKAAGPAADVYSLGAVLYALLTGRPPFQAPTPLETIRQVTDTEPVSPRQLQPGTPRDLETIALKCLAKDPGKRYPTADALADDLGRWRAGKPILARPAGPLERGWKWVRRNRGVTAAAAALFASLAAGAAASTWQAVRATEAEGRTAAALTDTEAAREAVQRQADQTERQRQRAEEGLAEADRVVDRFCRAVADHPKLRTPDFQDLRKGLLRDAADHYKRMADRRDGDPTARDRARDARRRLSVVLEGPDWNEGGQVLEEVRAELERLHAANPGDASVAQELAFTYVELSGRMMFAKRPADALDTARRALALFAMLPNATRSELAFAQDALGNALEALGKADESKAAYGRARALRTDGVKLRPPDNGGPLPPGVIGVADADGLAAALGKSVTVQGVVRTVSAPEGRAMTNLMFMDVVRVGFSARAESSFGDTFTADPMKVFPGRTVRVTGLLELTRGVPVIALTNAAQVEVVGGLPTTATTPSSPAGPPTPPLPLPPTDGIPAPDLKAITGRMGQAATIGGKVSAVGTSPSGSIRFINFDGVQARKGFSAVIMQEHLPAVEKALGGDLQRALTAETVWVTGTVADHKGLPQIVITDPKQITISAPVTER